MGEPRWQVDRCFVAMTTTTIGDLLEHEKAIRGVQRLCWQGSRFILYFLDQLLVGHVSQVTTREVTHFFQFLQLALNMLYRRLPPARVSAAPFHRRERYDGNSPRDP